MRECSAYVGLLGIDNLYDIGCGNQYQAFMMTHGNMTYTGIDANDSIDFVEMNQAFSNGFGERIKFVHGMYPFDISPPQNNAAIACGFAYSRDNEEQRKNAARFLSKDFERIITDVCIAGDNYDDTFKFWESALPEFKVCKLGNDKVQTIANRNLIFATKIQKDIDIMKEAEYDYIDDRFMVNSVELQEILAKLQMHKKEGEAE
jgi:hypothetical protein